MSRRIEWLDGVKGLACVGVALHHFSLAFLPATYYGDISISKFSSGFDVKMAQSPIGFFINGNYMVALFCLISALVLSLKVMGLQNKEEICNIFIKRYPRLMLPIVPVVLLVYVMLHFGWFYHLEIVPVTQSPWLGFYYLEKVGIGRCIESLFVTTWFASDSTFSNAFWMLGQLLFGSFLAIILSTFAWKANRKALGIIYLFCTILYVRVNTLHLAFVLGVLLAYCFREMKGMFGHTWLGVLCLLLGLFLGGYPSGIQPENIYRFLNCLPEVILSYQFWHIIGAFFTVYGIWNISILQKVLKCKLFQFLGRISYAVYVIHIPFIFSVSCYVFGKLVSAGWGYLYSVTGTFVCSMAMILLIEYIYNRYVEAACEKILNAAMKMVFPAKG